MTATYKLVKSPNPNTGETSLPQNLHPRLISCGTLHTDELIEIAKPKSSFSSADMKGVLQLLKDVLVDSLKAGYNVELDGIGIFSVSLQGQPVKHKEDIRSRSIHFKKVNFRTSKELKERLKTMDVFRNKGKESDLSPTSREECIRLLNGHLAKHNFLTQKDYERFCDCSRSKASIDLRKFVNDGVLSRKKVGNLYLYYKVEETVFNEIFLK